MANQPIIIQPARPPLSHLGETRRGSSNWSRPLLLSGLAIVLLSALVWVFTVTPASRPATGTPAAPATSPAGDTATPPQRAPFAELEYERQLAAAKEKLETLVETQIALKEAMQVGIWGEADYQAAMARATEGDVAFQAKRYEQAYIAYDEAAAAFTALKARGETLFNGHMERGQTALDERNAVVATQEFQAALVIRADDADALAGLARAKLLPEIIELMRQATNHELAGRWSDALAAYDTIVQRDPLTVGVAELRAKVGSANTRDAIKSALGRGFAAMKAGQFDQARSAFNRVLALDPGNAVATGALAQVSNQGEVNRIRDAEERALAAETREDWTAAEKIYADVLAIDSAIDFARVGAQRAKSHQRVTTVLEKIRAEPQKLSSPKLFSEATEALAEARTLQPGGTRLSGHIEAVAGLLQQYTEPVDLVITSDGKTDIMLSSVGRLGTFATRTVNLRPGEYTLVGSQQGCRDVRKNIIVGPSTNTVTIACSETVSQ